MNKAIIISAPSGAGKTTIVKHLLKEIPQLSFSVSACSRPKRDSESDGKDYYFISAEAFRKKIENDEFVEWQEVYTGSYYGTLKSELERIWQLGMVPIFDVDVVGGTNLKKYFGDQAMLVFIVPPSPEELEKRLRLRSTETEESLQKRLAKASFELEFRKYADRIIVNKEVENACSEASKIVTDFIES